MNQRTRKALGMFATVSFLTTYCLGFMLLAALYVTTAHPALQLVYFVIAGLGWLPGVMVIIRWMNRT